MDNSSVPEVVLIAIPAMPPSQNVRERRSRFAGPKETEQWCEFIRVYGPAAPMTPAKVRVDIHLVHPTGRALRDQDGAVGGTKSIRDALVQEGLAIDDTPASMEAGIPTQEYRRGVTLTEIRITPLSGPYLSREELRHRQDQRKARIQLQAAQRRMGVPVRKGPDRWGR